MLTYSVELHLDNASLNTLFSAAWPAHEPRDFQPILRQCLTHVTAHAGDRLVGYVHVAWDGGIHAFLLDVTVHPQWQRRGIGRGLVQQAVGATRSANIAPPIRWLHVDYEPHLDGFYRACGFRPTQAGLIAL